MDGKHPENFDQRPKRRPNEDNPYKLYTVGIKTDHPHYYLSFRDSAGVKQFMEIDKTLFDAFDRFGGVVEKAVFTTILLRFNAKTRRETPAYAKNSPVGQMAETPENQGFAAICRDT